VVRGSSSPRPVTIVRRGTLFRRLDGNKNRAYDHQNSMFLLYLYRSIRWLLFVLVTLRRVGEVQFNPVSYSIKGKGKYES
jgi:hypothetical protein